MFIPDKMHKQIQKSAKSFAAGEFEKEICHEMDKASQFRENIRVKAGDTGFIGIQFPEKYSGGGLGFVENALVAETLCQSDATAGCALTLSTPGAVFLINSDSESLKEQYTPDLTAGIMISAEAFSESASDPFYTEIGTTARKTETGWLINGKKINVLNGKSAGIYFILCRLENNGLGVFLADGRTEGIHSEKPKASLGLRMIERTDVVFTDLNLPDENLLKTFEPGADLLKNYIAENQVMLAAMASGIAKGAYDRTLKYTKMREQFGKKIAGFQISRHKIADMKTRTEVAFMMTMNAATAADAGRLTPELGAMTKQCAAENAIKVADEAIQLLGGYGYSSEYEVERYFRDAKVLELMGGAKARLKDIIADREIGKLK